jgi:Ca2+-binding RTX toxin-like protein
VPASQTSGALDTNNDIVIDTATQPGVTLTGTDADGIAVFNSLSGGAGDDTLIGGNSSNGGHVDNYLYSYDGNDTLTGGSADGVNPLTEGSNSAYNELYGGTGDDTLTGGNSSNGAVVYNYLYGQDQRGVRVSTPNRIFLRSQLMHSTRNTSSLPSIAPSSIIRANKRDGLYGSPG